MQPSLLSYPKKKNAANEVKDFHPISLVGGFIKLLLKSWPLNYARSWNNFNFTECFCEEQVDPRPYSDCQ